MGCLSRAALHRILFACLPLIFLAAGTRGFALEITNNHLSVGLEPGGVYKVALKNSGWIFSGKLPAAAQQEKLTAGQDAVGAYHQMAFSWAETAHTMSGTIRLYDSKDLVLFSDTDAHASPAPPAPFPHFTSVPADLFHLSYRDSLFAPVQYSFNDTTSSPWLFFDAQNHALLISAASHFLIATLGGDGQKEIASGFNPKLAHLPAGFTHQTLLAFGNGINRTYDLWGHALTDLQGKKRPANDADALLKYYGYWTDNGADYYYKYDAGKGYAGTIKALIDAYRQGQIPVRYLQLDSWWYHKTLTNANGTPGLPKKKDLPEGDWNRYGGLLDYSPAPFLFPRGLKVYQGEIGGLPFVTHNRWIDPESPYRQRFKVSGIAAVDPRFWDEIAGFCQANGIVTYEQDWLNEIFAHSPELSSTVDQGDAFLDNMARACREKGITIQYCMALPRCFLQAGKYDNVTTIRASGDRFAPRNYHKFIFGSRLAISLGIWPWTDVFKSSEINNLLLCNLSAGPVGTGDALGKENRDNIMKALRADGVIIKPDLPLLPTDASYLAEARGSDQPFIASTSTDLGGLKTIYAVAVTSEKASATHFTLNPADLGLTGPAYFYNYFTETATRQEKDQPLAGDVDSSRVSFFIIAPVGSSGIAFLGDQAKFVSTGKQRIASLKDEPGRLTTEVLLAPSEHEIVLHGYSAKPPSVEVPSGQAAPVQYDASTKHFSVVVKPGETLKADQQVDPVRHLMVIFKSGSSK